MRLTCRSALAILLLLGTPITDPTRAAAATPSLEGTAWTLASLPGRTLLPERVATVQFTRDRAAGTDGCNRYSGSYSATADGRFQLTNVAQTQMACPTEPGKQAQAFMAALSGARRTRLDGGTLMLLDGTGAVLATLAAQRDELTGTAWTVTGYNNGRQAVVSLLRDSVLTLEFGADGRISGTSGCNRYTGSYTQSKRTMKIGALGGTRRLCAKPAGVMAQETAFLAALQSAARSSLEGNRLELRTADDALAVSATRVAAERVAAATTGRATPADVAATESGRLQTYAADMVYMADAALPKPPGSPLHVTFEGTLADRPKMEGGGTASTVVVKRFIHAWPGETCERARADAQLTNTYWRIVRLGSTDVQGAADTREPHLTIRSAAKAGLQGDYSATVGCNTFKGGYAADGATLQFSPGASTRMACAPPLDDLERRLETMLAGTVRWQVKANTLELIDTRGGTAGLFQAIYF